MSALELLYIDPGTGSVLYQVILSGLLTGVVFFKRIKDFVLGRRSIEDEDHKKTL